MTARSLFDIFKQKYPTFADRVLKYKQISKNELQMITTVPKERFVFTYDKNGKWSFNITQE